MGTSRAESPRVRASGCGACTADGRIRRQRTVESSGGCGKIGRWRLKLGGLRAKAILAVWIFSCFVTPSLADGHGPAFSYSTSTLGKGDVGFETAVMWRAGSVMLGPRVVYGFRPNLQISFSSPFHVTHGDHPTGRFTAMMPGIPEAEVLVGWRFYHATPSVSTRNEATIYVGGSATTQPLPRSDSPPLGAQPAIYVALATGRVARAYDIWVGVGYQRYGEWETGELDHQSNTLLSSLAVGWRPSFLNKGYPKPDWRFFWETTGEEVGLARRQRTPGGKTGAHGHDAVWTSPMISRNTIIPPFPTSPTQILSNSGGTAVFSGPSFLCTYKSMAFQGGVLFAAFDQPNGRQPQEYIRAAVGFTYYILGRRK